MYKPIPEQTLSLTVEIVYSLFPEILKTTQTDFDEAIFVVAGVVNMFKVSDIKVIRVDLTNEKDMNFDSVHCRPPPDAYYTHPLVIEFIFPPMITSDLSASNQTVKIYGHIYCNLTYYDGLAALNSMYNILEHVEHHIIRPSLRNGRPSLFRSYSIVQQEGHLSLGTQFKMRNGKFVFTFQMWINSMIHYFSLKWLTFIGMIISLLYNPSFIIGPLSYKSKAKRVYKRYTSNDNNISFNELLKIADQSQHILGYPFASYTLNFSPLVAMGFCIRVLDMKNELKRKNSLVFPPGPAPPMIQPVIESMSNSVLWNNYGRHDPHIAGKTVAFVWDFVPVPAHFSPIFLVVTIQGTLFTLVNMPQPLMDKIESILKPLGQGDDYKTIQYSSLLAIPASESNSKSMTKHD